MRTFLIVCCLAYAAGQGYNYQASPGPQGYSYQNPVVQGNFLPINAGAATGGGATQGGALGVHIASVFEAGHQVGGQQAEGHQGATQQSFGQQSSGQLSGGHQGSVQQVGGVQQGGSQHGFSQQSNGQLSGGHQGGVQQTVGHQAGGQQGFGQQYGSQVAGGHQGGVQQTVSHQAGGQQGFGQQTGGHQGSGQQTGGHQGGAQFGGFLKGSLESTGLQSGQNAQGGFSGGSYTGGDVRTEYVKEFFTYHVDDKEYVNVNQGVLNSGVAKKNIRVVIIKGPEISGLEEAVATVNKNSNEQKLAIYVLTKQADIARLTQKLSTSDIQINSKPEVHFVKYKTDDDAEKAKQAIHKQYESLDGPSSSQDGGAVPVHTFASEKSQQGQAPAQATEGKAPADKAVGPASADPAPAGKAPESSAQAAPALGYLPSSVL